MGQESVNTGGIAGDNTTTYKNAVRAGSTGNVGGVYDSNALTLTAAGVGALPAQDGVTLAAGESLLLKNQSTGSQNGIYTITHPGDGSNPWVLTRRSDFNASEKIQPNMVVPISEGTAQEDSLWQVTTDAPIVLDTTSLTFAEFNTTMPTFQEVATAGSTAAITTDFTVTVTKSGALFRHHAEASAASINRSVITGDLAALEILHASSLAGIGEHYRIVFSEALGMTVEDTRASVGFVYAADYSANYTDRSLVDRGYVTGLNVSTFTNDAGYITGYAETDTLSDVLGRGATTAANDITFSKTGTASSTVTQASSQTALFEVSLWDGGAESIENASIQAVANTSQDRDFYLDFDFNGGLAMRLTKDSQLGIATAPAANTTLTVDGSNTAATDYAARFRDGSDGNILLIRNDGNVGIGVNATAPTSNLFIAVNQDAATWAHISNTTTGASAQAALRITGDSGYSQFQSPSSTASNTQLRSNGVWYGSAGLSELMLAHDTSSGKISFRIGGSVATNANRRRVTVGFISGAGDMWGLALGNNLDPAAKLHIGSENLSRDAWGTNGIAIREDAKIYTDASTAGSGTATNAVINSIGTPTLAATNTSVTTTYAATWYIAAAPSAGTNMTITNSYSLWIDDGDVRFDSNVVMGVDTPHASMTNGIAMGNGTDPSASITDGFAMYSSDAAAGNAAPTFRTENDEVIILYEVNSYTRNATVVEDRTLLASASATATNNNNVLAALIADLQTVGLLGGT